VARDINLGEHIRLGGGELKSGSYRRDAILSDAFEALIAAIYLDSGYSQAEQTVLRLFHDRLRSVDVAKTMKDPKTQLQEYLQGQQHELPSYELSQTSGKSHEPVFTVCCKLADLDLSSLGKGSSRKKAEQQAARKILDKLGL